MRTAGIDLSLTSTGVALVDTEGETRVERLRSSGTRADSLLLRCARLERLAGEVIALVSGHRPDLVVIEAPAFGTPGGSVHDRSGLWWLVVADLTQTFPLVEVGNTARAKYATGVGGGANAGKDAVLAAVVRRYGDVDVQGNDVADALLLACMGARHLGAPVEAHLPAVNLEAMRKVRWPEAVPA